MLINPCLKIGVFDGLLEADQDGSVGDDFLEVVHGFVFLDDGNGAQAVVEVREEVGDGVGVFEPGEDDRPVEGVVEAVQVDEVDDVLVRVLDLGHFAGA